MTQRPRDRPEPVDKFPVTSKGTTVRYTEPSFIAKQSLFIIALLLNFYHLQYIYKGLIRALESYNDNRNYHQFCVYCRAQIHARSLPRSVPPINTIANPG
jgi:hypothetical protein